jgi:hypothetical protein
MFFIVFAIATRLWAVARFEKKLHSYGSSTVQLLGSFQSIVLRLICDCPGVGFA